MSEPHFLKEHLQHREEQGLLRKLPESNGGIDFASNDYLGLAANSNQDLPHGSTGSRLLTGNHKKFQEVEQQIANFHQAEAALIFNSGYQANLAILSAVPRRNDIIIYDQLVHASIRDGIQLGKASSFSFRHNDAEDLKRKLERGQGEKFVVIESVYSMDGDISALDQIVDVCKKHKAHLMVDEAHALGVLGDKGEGLVQNYRLVNEVMARVFTYGKAAGGHGAAIVGSKTLIDFLVNFGRPFIYSTAIAPSTLPSILEAYDELESGNKVALLRENISYFSALCNELGIPGVEPNKTAIQSLQVAGNENARRLAAGIQKRGFKVFPILSPTVPEGKERIRISIHSNHSKEEIKALLNCIKEVQ